MNILAFKITPAGSLPHKTQTRTLDEMTRELPQGFYTTFSTLSNATKVMGLHAHLQRLYVPALELGLVPAVDESTLRNRIADLAKMNLPKESRIRLILTKDSGTVYAGIQLFQPLPQSVYRDGVHVITSHVSRSDPRIKGTDFIAKSAEQRKLVRGNVFEVLLSDDGKILEGMTSNFYAVKGNMLVTAQKGILLGVTRRAVLRLARGEGMSIEYRAPRYAVGGKFDEAFLTSSSRGVVPIVSIDGSPVGEGKAGEWTKRLMKVHREYVERKAEGIADW